MTKRKPDGYNKLCLFGVITMMLSIKQLASSGESVEIKQTLDFPGLAEDLGDIRISGKLDVDLTASAVQGLILVEGTLTIPIEYPCSRCLVPARDTLVIPFYERFAQREEDLSADDPDSEDVHLVEDDRISLEPYLVESVWLSLPLAPVCREDCKGLCHQCGTNLNEETCDCRKDRIDPRLAGLADLFDKLQ